MTTTRRPTRSQGEVESAVSEAMCRAVRELIGRGPRHVTTTIRGPTMFIHLQGVLTTAEERLIAPGESAAAGREMVRQMRHQIMLAAMPSLQTALEGPLGRVASAMLHDVSPDSDQEVFVFNLRGEGVVGVP